MTTEAEAYQGLAAIFSDVFLRDDIELRPDMTADDVEQWDSFKHLEIIMGAEEKFGITFTTGELDSMKTVGDLVKSIVARP